MSLLEQPRSEVDSLKPVSVSRPAVKISIATGKASVDAYTSALNVDNVVANHDRLVRFGLTGGWLALGADVSNTDSLILAHPWGPNAETVPNRLPGGLDRQVLLLLGGVRANDVSFEALRSFDPDEVDADEPVQVEHEEGKFSIPRGYLVPGGDPTGLTIYTDRFVLSGVGGVNIANIYCAQEPVQEPAYTGRHYQ